MRRAELQGIEVQPQECDGIEAMVCLDRQWWQSRMVTAGQVPDPPELIHPVEIVKQMRLT